MEKVSSRQRQAAISLIMTLLAFVLFYFVVVTPIENQMHSLDDRISSKSTQLIQFQAIAVERASIENALTNIQSALADDNSFIKSENNTLAAAVLQENVKSIIQKNGGTLISIQDTATSKSELMESVQLKVNMSGDIEVLKGILYQFSVNQPLLFLDKLDIQKANQTRLTRNRNVHLAADDLRINFEVSAYVLVNNKK